MSSHADCNARAPFVSYGSFAAGQSRSTGHAPAAPVQRAIAAASTATQSLKADAERVFALANPDLTPADRSFEMRLLITVVSKCVSCAFTL